MLVNTVEMFKKAYAGKYAIGAFNVNNMELVQGIIEACIELRSPVILQASAGAIKYAGLTNIIALTKAAQEDSKKFIKGGLPIALNLDHGDSFESCKLCIDSGFTSIMIDASHYDFAKNVELTKKVVDYARRVGGKNPSKPKYISVEAELGRLAGIEDNIDVSEADSAFTDPREVSEFVKQTGVDSLAIAIGTSHGAFKFKGEPKLRYDILEQIQSLVPGFPLVLHGASSVPQKYLDIITKYGGDVSGARGVPEALLKKATSLGVSKINIDSDLRMAFTAGIREFTAQNPSNFDPRSYLKHAREYVKELVKDKILNVLGSDNKV
ncbi:MAG: ketose-bisphosphate aldolase [Firmicutes bacterium]|nr:ketose-bisphosphate aldolase [Bacillota bacterium]